jgi:hypothetical protein
MGKALIAHVFHQSFSEVDKLDVCDYKYFVKQAETALTDSRRS